jgi:hypothetical protein
MHHHDIRDHMEVLSADGKHVGAVDRLEDDGVIKLAKKDPSAGGKHHFIPLDWVDFVDDKVHLTKTAVEAIVQWRTVH